MTADRAREMLEGAIKATEYKYFGDYEMSDDQREAVDVLVSHARKSLGVSPNINSYSDGYDDAIEAERVRVASVIDRFIDEYEEYRSPGAEASVAALRTVRRFVLRTNGGGEP